MSPLPRTKETPKKSDKNREAWLTELALMVQPLFRGFTMDDYRISCSWPSKLALGRRIRRLGECYDVKASTGGVHEIFVTPLIDKPLEVAGVTCHELAHVAAGVKSGHKGLYLKVIRQVGLTKNKPTQAMPGPVLEEHLIRLVEKLGPYPHSAMQPFLQDEKEKTKSSFSVVCPECGCLCHMSNKWIQEVGFPTCACGSEMELKQ